MERLKEHCASKPRVFVSICHLPSGSSKHNFCSSTFVVTTFLDWVLDGDSDILFFFFCGIVQLNLFSAMQKTSHILISAWWLNAAFQRHCLYITVLCTDTNTRIFLDSISIFLPKVIYVLRKHLTISLQHSVLIN